MSEPEFIQSTYNLVHRNAHEKHQSSQLAVWSECSSVLADTRLLCHI